MEPRYTTIIRATELKLILIPVFFLLTRVWGLVLDILIIIDDKEANKANEALVFLAVRVLHSMFFYYVYCLFNRELETLLKDS